jgi:hypothetical protein
MSLSALLTNAFSGTSESTEVGIEGLEFKYRYLLIRGLTSLSI